MSREIDRMKQEIRRLDMLKVAGTQLSIPGGDKNRHSGLSVRSPLKLSLVNVDSSPMRINDGATGMSPTKLKSLSPLRAMRQPSEARKVSQSKFKDLLSPVKLATGAKKSRLQMIALSPARAFDGEGKSSLGLRKEYSKEGPRGGDHIGRMVTYGGEEHGSDDEDIIDMDPHEAKRVSSRRQRDRHRRRLHEIFLDKDT